MSTRICLGKIGVSDAKYAADKAALAAQIKAQVLAEIQREYPEVLTASDTLTVIFYEGAIRGSVEGVAGKMLLTTTAGVQEAKDFATLNADLPAYLTSFFESGEFGDVNVPLKDKSTGASKTDAQGNVINEKMVKFFNHPFFHKQGVDTEGNNYELFSIAKYGTMPAGYVSHHAFINSDNSTYKDYILISKYPLSEITCGDNTIFNGSFSGKVPISEVQPETRIHPRRSKDQQGMRWEMLYFAMLCAIIYGDRAMGYQDNASLQLENHFCGNAKDCGDGYQLNTTGNANSASNTFCVNKVNGADPQEYAEIAIGAKVTFLSNTNYASYGNSSNANTSVSRTITNKEDMGSYYKFTFDGEAYLSYNKRLHCNFMGETGVTDSINHISGYRTEYPKGYQPFKLLGIENPFGQYAIWLDWLYDNNSSSTRLYEFGSQDPTNTGTWTNISHTNLATGWIKTWGMNASRNVLLPASHGASSVSYYAVRYRKAGTTAMVYGRDNETDYKHGSLFSYASCGGSAWSALANGALHNGCWGRVYRSVL